MRVRGLVVVAVCTTLLIALPVSPARAATAQGCSGSISSVDDHGASLDTVAVPGAGGSDADPFRLYWAAPVTWTGQTAQPVAGGTWRLTVQHPSVLFALGELLTGHVDGLHGTFDPAQAGSSFTNTFTPSSIEPVTLPGTYQVGFAVAGNGGVACAGTISVRVMDPPGHNPLWWLALVLILAGLAMFVVFGVSKWTRPVYVRTGERAARP